MALTIVAQKSWAYTLYQDEKQVFILSVLCGGVGMYELNIPLSSKDGERAQGDDTFLEQLVESIRAHPLDYSEKSIKISE